MWTYKNNIIDALPTDCVGFVYCIVNSTNNRKYIGKKLSKFSKTRYKMVTLKSGIKKRKKIKSLIESDWMEYYGSSIELLKDVEIFGKDNFAREILYLCKSKAECSYLEASEQFSRQVLESDDYYNNQISVRVHGSHIRGKLCQTQT